jgi:hypothetical protein
VAGYLIAVNYKVLGVAAKVISGVADGMFPDQATAISDTITRVTNYRATKGETITNVAALVNATR